MIKIHCNNCTRIINEDKHEFIYVNKIRTSRNLLSIRDLHFCSIDCLVAWKEKEINEE